MRGARESGPSAPTSLSDRTLGSAAAALALACYAHALHGGFVFDDTYAITGNADVTGADGVGWWEALPRIFLQHDFWGQDIAKPDSHKSYRPLTTLSFRLCHAWGGGAPESYHAVNVLLHALASYLVVTLSRRTGADRPSSLLAGCWFAAHPVHVEAVTGLVGRADVLSSVLLLLGALTCQRPRRVYPRRARTLLCVCFLVLATLSKETGVDANP